MPALPRLARSAVLTAVLLFAAHPAPATGPAGELDPRSLPSLVVRWECHCNAAGMAVADGAVFVQEYRRLFALGAETHELLWDRKLEESPGYPQGPLVLPGRVAATWGDRMLLLDAATGVEIADLTFDGSVDHLVGPPLAVAITRKADDDASGFVDEVIRIDPESGAVIARREVNVLSLAAIPGGPGRAPRLLAVSFGPPEAKPSARKGRLVELSGEDLTTLESWPGAISHVLQGRGASAGAFLVPFVSSPEGQGVRRYDPDTGELGSELLVRPREGDFLNDLDLDLQATAGADPGEPEAIRRLDPETGEVLWTTELPDPAGGWVRDGGRLFVHTRPLQRGRGLLLTLSWATGEIERAVYGLRDVQAIERWQDRLILQGSDGVVAVAADEVGPPESELRPVETEVDRILERLAGSSFPLAEPGVTQDLLALGEEAMPVLAARFEELPLPSAMAVAPVFGLAGYEPAAPMLARRLASVEGPLSGPPEAVRSRPEVPLLHALGRLGGPEQVDAVGELLLDGERPILVRERAAAALAQMGGEAGLPETLPWIDRFYRQRRAEARGWWEVARESESWWSRVGLEPRVEETGTAAFGRDRDEDGVPDRVEEALGTDPARADSDGDQRPDGVDPAPLGGAEPQSEEERIRLAVVRHWAAFRSENHEVPVCIVSERSLEWADAGSGRVLLPLAPGQKAEGCRRLDAHPATEEERAKHEGQYGELAPGERLWILNESETWSAEGSWVVVRQVGDRWLVRELALSWIS